MCVCCPALRSSSRQPVKRYKKSVLSHFSWRHSVAQKMTIFKLLLLVLVLEFSTESMAAPGCASNQTDSYDELLLVLQWPASFCNTHECDNRGHIPDNFIVHGLWLNKKSKAACCPGPPWPRLQNESIPEDMKNWWPDLKDQRDPRSFWNYEYGKHGSCNINQSQYFQTARHIWNLIGDTRSMRLKSGKTLATQQYYQVSEFEYVTIANTTLYPTLRCNYAVVTQGIHLQLLEIVFCTDKQLRLQRCTIHFNSCNGPRGFYFTPVTPRGFYFPPVGFYFPPLTRRDLYFQPVTPTLRLWIDGRYPNGGSGNGPHGLYFQPVTPPPRLWIDGRYPNGGSGNVPHGFWINGQYCHAQNVVRNVVNEVIHHPLFNSCIVPHGIYFPPVTPPPGLWIDDQTSIDGPYCHAQNPVLHRPNRGFPRMRAQNERYHPYRMPAHKRRIP